MVAADHKFLISVGSLDESVFQWFCPTPSSFCPSRPLSPTHPVPRGLLTLCPAPYQLSPVPRGLLTLCPAAYSGPQGQQAAGHRVSRR